MDDLINSLNTLSLQQQKNTLRFVKEDLESIAKAVNDHPDEVNAQLIEFPPFITEEIDSVSIEIAITYLKKNGLSDLYKLIPQHSRLHADGYFDYYIDCLLELREFIK